jgi:hypothetical protein
MSDAPQDSEYLAIIERFLAGELSPGDFCDQFTVVWMKDRDEISARSRTWPRPYDQELLAAWQRGEISEEALHQGTAQLFGYDLAFQDMVDRIHSACSVYRPDPEELWEIGEDRLRQDVQQALSDYGART